ncbi:MAG TPA: heme o synthase [Polyangiaceae bacterium]|nr:heme o synthase [Polyangiaceae bacterium]
MSTPVSVENAPEPAAHAPSSPPQAEARMGRAFWELSKPAITRMVLITTGLGVLAAPSPTLLSDLVPIVLGTGLLVAGANALNMFIERESDAFMQRTRARPLPAGRLEPDAALAFGVSVSIGGLILLAQFASMLAVALGVFALLSYVLVYTPLKRVSPIALYVGAIPGGLPPAIGYAAVTGSFDRVCTCLFLLLLVWQIPHFLAITLFRSEEYGRAGLKVLPVVRGLPYTRKATVLWSGLLLLTSLLPVALGVAPLWYGAVALVAGLALCFFAARTLFDPSPKVAKQMFFASMPHLVVVMAALVISVI